MLGTEFNPRTLTKKEKEVLEKSFSAQVYAFRKLRDKMLLNENHGDIYTVKKLAFKIPPKKEQTVNLNKA